MKVQPIQRSNNINSKAHFVDDSNGYLRTIYKNAVKYANIDLELAIDKFSRNNINDVLEITSLKSREELQADKGKCVVFNRSNGRFRALSLFGDNTARYLMQILEQIEQNSGYLFEKSEHDVIMYKKLTGQNW